MSAPAQVLVPGTVVAKAANDFPYELGEFSNTYSNHQMGIIMRLAKIIRLVSPCDFES